MIPFKYVRPSDQTPWITAVLVFVNLAVFLAHKALPHRVALERLMYKWAVVPQRLIEFPRSEWPTLLSSLFLHQGWAHVLGNMAYLWIFGGRVETRIKPSIYLSSYLAFGAIASLVQAFTSAESMGPAFGASGAIAGVMGLALALEPMERVRTFLPMGWAVPTPHGLIPFGVIRIVSVPAFLFLVFWFLLQALQAIETTVTGVTGGVAFWAHTAGFVSGYGAGLLMRGRRRASEDGR